ncbi:hypothetical protein [Streptomyces aidingensis]|uniref:DUF3558 domain-containing protein n=1 Tax=Streptomyces aidingensis TaxID=910347 RepID=A0A1I1HWG5_9ACTN|nr:hypothetical protein [Streptomyces aidingensis]SFC28115.1 hypothetical protein SAMN05421773_102543 [Streptomyces aidingensis]
MPPVLPAGVLALLLALLPAAAGCTSDLMDDDPDGTARGAAASPAASGRHSGLPEPCGAVEEDRLRELLPEAGPEELTGEPALTFDTGRQAACSWRSPGESGTRELSVEFVRVVSYDPEISDDDQAALDFARSAAERDIPPLAGQDTAGQEEDGDGDTPGSADGTDDTAGSADSSDPSDPDNAADAGGTDSTDGTGESADPGSGDGTGGPAGWSGPAAGTSAPTSPVGELAPRSLEGIGHAAFIDDQLTPTNSGSRRDIVLTFHNANVIVTISYRETTGEDDGEPDSAVLQERVRKLAGQLAGLLDE